MTIYVIITLARCFRSRCLLYAWVRVYPHEHKGIFPQNHDYFIGPLIWKAPKSYNVIQICKEAKTLIVVDTWLDSLNFEMVEIPLLNYVSTNRQSELWRLSAPKDIVSFVSLMSCQA